MAHSNLKRIIFLIVLTFSFVVGNICMLSAQNRNNVKHVVLSKEKSFQSQVIEPNTIYDVYNNFDLNNAVVILPENCVLNFYKGSIRNGTIENCGIVENKGNGKVFRDIVFKRPLEQEVKLSWFDYSSDADALENAAKFKHVDGSGSWTIDKPVSIKNDLILENGIFTCKYGIYNITITSPDIYESNYSGKIKKGALEIPFKLKYSEAEAVAITSSDVYYKTERSNYRNGTRGEVMTIKNVSRKKVTFDTKNGTVCEYKNNIKLIFFRTINVTLRSCRFHSVYNDSSDKGGVLVRIEKAKASVDDCSFSGCSVGLSLGDCISSVVSECSFDKIYPWALAFSGGTCNSTVKNCSFDVNRHGWTTLGEASVVKYCTITNNICKNSLLAICPHANAYGITISNNTIDGSRGGVGSFAPNCTIKDNHILMQDFDLTHE